MLHGVIEEELKILKQDSVCNNSKHISADERTNLNSLGF